MCERSTDSLSPAGAAGGIAGGASGHGPGTGFCPAFRDEGSGEVYVSRRADGSCAPVHLLDGLPDALVAERDAEGHALSLRRDVTPGYIYQGRFYTREEAGRASQERAVGGR